MASEWFVFTVQITCPHCGQPGAVQWEEDDGLTAAPKAKRRLVQVFQGFHAETGRTASGDPLIVCSVCDTIQDD